MSRKFLFCKECGSVEISTRNYTYQMSHADSRWYCPICGRTALWDGMYDQCIDCGELVSEDAEECPHCGSDQSETDYGWPGD